MRLIVNREIYGVFYTKKRILKFKNPSEMISNEDIMNLFAGFVRLIKKSAQLEVEEKYCNQIHQLKNEIKYLKRKFN